MATFAQDVFAAMPGMPSGQDILGWITQLLQQQGPQARTLQPQQSPMADVINQTPIADTLQPSGALLRPPPMAPRRMDLPPVGGALAATPNLDMLTQLNNSGRLGAPRRPV